LLSPVELAINCCDYSPALVNLMTVTAKAIHVPRTKQNQTIAILVGYVSLLLRVGIKLRCEEGMLFLETYI
jgi:hypothetical protein